MTRNDYLLELYRSASKSNSEYAQYLYGRVMERVEAGRSSDSDEYRELLRIAGRAS
jgi:hypothetical protein